MKNKIIDNQKEIYIFAKIFLATIAVHWFIMALCYILFDKNGESVSGFFADFYTVFGKCGDTPHYLNIAKNGYAATGETANQIVFYPLYPYLLKVFALVFRNYFVSGVILSNLCLGISGYLMYKLTEVELGVSKAIDGYLLYLVYPFSAFLVGVFTESLFMMLTILSLLCIKKEKWLAAGIVGMLAALSRSQGIALLVPAVYETVVCMIKQKKFNVKSLGVFFIPVGTFLYLLLNKVVQGDWFAFVAHQEAEPWYNKSNWIAANLSQHYGMAKAYFNLGLLIYWVQIVLYFVLLIGLFYGIKKKISTSIIAYGGAYIFLSFLHGWLISGPRYMMGCITMYIVYSSIDNKIIKNVILFGFAILSIFYTFCLWQGQAIM